jgi:hypothetical protein
VKERIYICPDNKAVITTLAKPSPKQLWEGMQALET